jgi:hypothetical protein
LVCSVIDVGQCKRLLRRKMALSEPLTSLIYELLDAHHDTVRIAAGTTLDVTWRAHLDYLRDLQRVGRELLAAAAEHDGTPFRSR